MLVLLGAPYALSPFLRAHCTREFDVCEPTDGDWAKLHAAYTKTTRGKTEEIDLMICYARVVVGDKHGNVRLRIHK